MIKIKNINNKLDIILKISLLFCSSLLLFLIVYLPSVEVVLKSFNEYSYYFILVAVIMWIIFLVNVGSRNFLFFIHENKYAIILSILITATVFNLSPPQFYILADETNLLGVSLSMYLDKESSVPMEGYDFEGSFKSTVL